MRFWDASALVPLLVDEARSGWARALLESDDEVIAWWGTPVECASAVARLEREERLSPQRASAALALLDSIAAASTEVSPGEAVRARARRLLRVHRLRSADALQLAAALVASEDHPETLPFVSLDERLAVAADREGFPVVPSAEPPASPPAPTP